ncbi:MAG: spondin domain-containing protein [Gloeobacterales cyanobacterium]
MKFSKLAFGMTLVITAVVGISSAGFSASKGYPQTTLSQTTKSAPTKFKVRIENISVKDQFTASNGTKWTLDFSPGVWLIHNTPEPLFTIGQKDRGQGLEAIAEDGNPTMLAKSLKDQSGVLSSGVFDTAVGANKAGGIRPGQVFEFTVSATPGQQLSIATMFGQSNDWFYAPVGSGITLFDAQGAPMGGDVTSQMVLLNDGTEVDEEPGIGPNQGPRQKAPNTGAEENGVVQKVNDQAAYGETEKVMRVTITPQS